MKVYQSKDIQEIAGLTRLQVKRLVELGGVVPFKDAVGRGGIRRFSGDNLYQFQAAGLLFQCGFSTRDVCEILKEWAKHPLWLFTRALDLWQEVRSIKSPPFKGATTERVFYSEPT